MASHQCKRCRNWIFSGGKCSCKLVGHYWRDGEETTDENATEVWSTWPIGDDDEIVAEVGARLNDDDSEQFNSSSQEIEIHFRRLKSDEEPNPKIGLYVIQREWDPIFNARKRSEA